MIVYVYPADRFGCGYYRLIWPALALKAQGHDVRVVMPHAREGIGGDLDTRTGKLIDTRLPSPKDPFGLGRQLPSDADVIVMQRVSMLNLSQAIPMMRAKGVAVVVDMDDDLTKIDPANPAFYGLGTKTGDRRHNWRNAHQACLDATFVTVSTPALLKVYAPHGRGVVLENRIPQSYLEVKHVDSARFGWPGSVHSHPNDLQAIGPAAARLVREGGEYFGIGPSYGFTPGDGLLRRALGLDEDPETSGNVDFDEWPKALTHLGIGLAPLADTEFNRAKSWLKPLELMACGVPWVASPSAEYQRLHLLTGVGLMAKTPKDWYRQIKRLINDSDLRQEQSALGREVAWEHTIEGHAWRWLEAWESARKLQRQMTSASV